MLLPLMAVASQLSDMSLAIEALGRYEVRFSIYVDGIDATGEGRYLVDGGRYYLEIAGQQIYGDSQQRCSVDHNNREVILERLEVDDQSPMIIVNPAEAFTSLERYFDAEEMGSEDDRVAFKLTPKSGANILESTLLEVDRATKLPRVVTYFANDEVVEVMLHNISSFDGSPSATTPTYPDDYDIIDIR